MVFLFKLTLIVAKTSRIIIMLIFIRTAMIIKLVKFIHNNHFKKGILFEYSWYILRSIILCISSSSFSLLKRQFLKIFSILMSQFIQNFIK